MRIKKAAVLPALGIGDALLMMIASHQLKEQSYEVTTFHDELIQLKDWFPGQSFKKAKELNIDDLSAFDLIILENDNSLRIKELLNRYRQVISIFYPTYSPQKHALLTPHDFAFDPSVSMVQNIARSIATLLHLRRPSTSNGITPPPFLVHKKHLKRVLLHPTSRNPAKNWTTSGFLRLAQALVKKGYSPLFCISPAEKEKWTPLLSSMEVANLTDLTALAACVYESGAVIGNDSLLGHLGSNLGLPTLVIANDEQRMRLWKPGWTEGTLVLPPKWTPNFKGFRCKDNYWQSFISHKKVLSRFEKLLSTL